MQGKRKALLAVLMCCSSVLAVQADNGVYELNPVLVTAQRMQTDELRTPATVQVISAAQVSRSGAYGTYDALRRTIGMSDYSYDNGQGSNGSSVARVYLRGLDKGTLLLVNGTPLNQMNYASPEAIPQEAIERIEIVKGANAALYGAEAMGGVVNIITKTPQAIKTEVSVTGSLGKYENNVGITVQGENFLATYGQTKWAEWANAQYPYKKYVSGYYARSKEQAFASVRLSPEWTLNWAHAKTKSGMFYDSRNKPGVRDNGKGVAGYKYTDTRDNVNFQYVGDRGGLQLRLAYNTKQVVGDRDNTDGTVVPGGNSSNYRVNNFYVDVQQEQAVASGHWVYGLTAYREEYKQVRLGTGKEIGRNQLAIFGSYEWRITDRWALTLGVREQFSLNNGWDKQQKVFLPQVQSSYMLTPEWNWYINIGKSFEMPAINNKYARGNQKPSPLKPQRGWTYETGLKMASDRNSLKVAAFYMDIDDLFGWEQMKNIDPAYPDPEQYIQVNRGDFRNKGIEIEYRKQVTPEFGWFIGYTAQNPRNRETPKAPWLQTDAKQMGTFGFDWIRERWSWSVDGYVEAERQNTVAATEYGKGNMIPKRVSLNSTLQLYVSDETQLQLTVRNLLNRENYTRNMWKERPRSIMFSVTHRF